MSKKKKRRSCCPIALTLDVIGDRWTLLVVRDLLLGRTQFKEFAGSPEGIATNILTDRLDRLVQHGIAERIPQPDVPARSAYRLTRKGKSLGPVVQSMVKWGTRHIPGADAKMKSRA